jgi:signal transduction histidine kinase
VGLAVVVDLIVWDGDRRMIGGQMLPALVVPVITVAVYSTLLLRWRHPVHVFCLQWVFPFSCLLLPGFQPFAGLLLALHAVAVRRPARWSVAALVATGVPLGLYSALRSDPRSPGWIGALIGLFVLWMLLAAATWGVGRLSFVAAERALRLRELHRAEAAATAQAERMHLARELHDIVAHTVTIMMIQASGAKAVLGPGQPQVRNALEVIETSGIQAMSELHRMLNLLRMPESGAQLPAPGTQPTVADIDQLVGSALRAGGDVSLMEEGMPGALDPSVEAAAYRVVQESITNALKHGGPAAAVMVWLRWSELMVEVEVADTERGPRPGPEDTAALSSGHGLAGLRERVTMVGGTIDYGPVEGGFVVRARLPRPHVRLTPLLGTGRQR